MYSYVLFLVIFSTGYVNSECPLPSERSAEAVLREKIFCNYNKTARPTKNYANATNVYMLLYPTRIYMDHFEETLSVHGHVFYSWRDQYLSWVPAEHEGIEFLITTSNEIWVPDIIVDTASGSMGSNRITNVYSALSHTGDVFGFSLLNIVTHCISDLTKFPYDTQNCTFSISSQGYLGKYVNLSLIDRRNGIVMNKYIPNKVWQITDYSAVRLVKNFGLQGEHDNEGYPFIIFNIVLLRHASGQEAVVVVPCIGLALITLLTFLTHSTNNRLILCSVSIVGDILYITFLAFWLPQNGDNTPVIITFYRDSLLISMLAFVIAIFVQHISSKTNVPNTWITGLIFKLESSPLGNIFLNDTTPKEDDTVDIIEGQKENKVTTWSQFAFFIDRASLIICTLIYTVLSIFYLP